MSSANQELSKAEIRVHTLKKIEQLCVVEAKELLDSGYTTQALTSLVLGMEWLGAVIDGKPSGAKNQSRKRFEKALSLFSGDYSDAHRQIDLYKRLRNRMIHNPWINSRSLDLSKNCDQHLITVDEKILFSPSQFCEDFSIVLDNMNS